MTDYIYTEDEFNLRLEKQSLITREFWDAAIQYYLEDHDDFRSPFPERMREELEEKTFRQFMEWTFQLVDPGSASEEMFSQKFDEIIHRVGLSLAQSDEERLTIQYPELPRIGDRINAHEGESDGRRGEIINRWLVEIDGKKCELPCVLMTRVKSGKQGLI